MPNKYNVIVSEKATQMLVTHATFLARVSPAAAEQLVDDLKESADSLELMPERCAWLKGDYIPPFKYRFIVFQKRYMLIYQIVEDIVYVDYVIDCRSDYQ